MKTPYTAHLIRLLHSGSPEEIAQAAQRAARYEPETFVLEAWHRLQYQAEHFHYFAPLMAWSEDDIQRFLQYASQIRSKDTEPSLQAIAQHFPTAQAHSSRAPWQALWFFRQQNWAGLIDLLEQGMPSDFLLQHICLSDAPQGLEAVRPYIKQTLKDPVVVLSLALIDSNTTLLDTILGAYSEDELQGLCAQSAAKHTQDLADYIVGYCLRHLDGTAAPRKRII